MSNQSNDSPRGMTGIELLCVALTVLFVGLKLAGVISWSWWWVWSPIWIPFVIVGVIIGCVVLYFAAVLGATIVADRWSKWRKQSK